MKTMQSLFAVLLFVVGSSQAQSTRKAYADIDIGWLRKIEFKEPPKAIINQDRNYTAKQAGYAQAMLTWIQQTYSPKGMLGDMKWYTFVPDKSEPVTSKDYDYNEAEKNNRNAWPNYYGAYAKLSLFLKKDASGKFVPETGHHIRWLIEANGVETISKQLVSLSTPEEYYFLMPRYEVGLKGSLDKTWYAEAAKFRNFTNHPNLKNYVHYYIPNGQVTDGKDDFYVVIMTKNRQPLPFEQVTVGEFIRQVEKQLPLMYQMAINGGSKDINLKARANGGFQIFKKRFAAKANENVYLSENNQLGLFDFANADENSTFPWFQTSSGTFQNSDGYPTFFPLLKLKKGVKEASVSGDPQWLVVRWAPPLSKNLAGDIHYMDTILNRFNYEYVYNYFFGDKRPTESYKPLD
ncbi:hypothetical protein [Olivibacter sitiensis]|uniref:hypothetical protein n=1 Tax=Olivibacter sitiensis TaxID=376470 RepID=UPI0004254DDB|nr:hypothetical protein [Olivibacter sitiensis]